MNQMKHSQMTKIQQEKLNVFSKFWNQSQRRKFYTHLNVAEKLINMDSSATQGQRKAGNETQKILRSDVHTVHKGNLEH